jgi:hypothetical protein
MPTSDWNGKLQGVGNGGWAGIISYYYGPWPLSLASALRRGYAAASLILGTSAKWVTGASPSATQRSPSTLPIAPFTR